VDLRPARVAAILLALALAATAAGQPGGEVAQEGPPVDPRLPFTVREGEDGRPRLVLGPNRFTTGQYARFLAGLDAFLERASAAPADQQLTWRVDGERGYLSVSTSPFAGGPRFLVTLRGERVRSFDGDAALLNAFTLVGFRLLQAERAERSGVGRGAFPLELAP
jgi:hypothetical protein